MGEQVIFDNTLIRTVQTRSCDQCFLHKSKCSRHAPCHACVTHRRPCTYRRQSQYRRQNQSIRRPRLVDTPSSSTSVEAADLNRAVEEVQNGEASSSPEEVNTHNGVATEQTGETFNELFASVCEDSNFDGLEWMRFSFPTDMMMPEDVGQPNASPILEDGIPQPFRSMPWPANIQDLGCPTDFNLQLTRPAVPDNISLMINLFLDRLHPSMPFFKRSYLTDNILAKRYLYDQRFNALIHAISALAVFQMVQKGSERPSSSDHIDKAEYLLAEAVRLHSHTDFGESPVLEQVLTSVFLFGCQFSKGNHHAARFRLREAVTLAETMGLDDPQTYGNITRDEKDRRLRTFLCLAVIHRVYAIQRDTPVNDYLLTSSRLHMVRNMLKQISMSSDDPEVRVIAGLGYMVDLIDFVDSTFVKCWRNQCWRDSSANHVSAKTIATLLQRYTAPITMRESPNDAQRADVLITRHWICHILWDLGSRHGFMHRGSPVPHMRPDYALTIACDSIETCESLDMACLECHGIGLVEKLYDIATSAIKSTQPTEVVPVISHQPSAMLNQNRSATGTWPVAATLVEPISDETEESPWDNNTTVTNTPCLADFANKFLVIFASFRGGKHPYLKPYMRMLCDLDIC